MICTQSSTENGKECKHTLQHIDPPMPQHFQPVGRLDQHSHGLLLFSRDGRLTSALLSPSSSIERVYRIVVRGDVGINENTGMNGEQKDFAGLLQISNYSIMSRDSCVTYKRKQMALFLLLTFSLEYKVLCT